MSAVIDADALDEQARDIMRGNDKGRYTVPTHGLYPYQWNWDSAFAAMGFATFDIDRAWTELETLFSGQWDNGMVPHILFHQPSPSYFPGPDVWHGTGPVSSTGITQPPVAATLARIVFDCDPAKGAERLGPMFDKFAAWHRWFMRWRLDRDAVCVTHPWESGRDNAPDWDIGMAAIQPGDVGEYTRADTSHVDASMRPTKWDYDRFLWLTRRGAGMGWDEGAMLEDTPFRVADPTMTFTLLRAQRDLAALGNAIGRDVSEIDTWIAQLEAGAETLWNADMESYDSRDARSGEYAGAVTNASFLCWFAGVDRPEMLERLRTVLKRVEYGVPSLDPNDERFDRKRYWRGPVWAVMNMMIGLGLEEKRQPEGAAIREATRRLIAAHGFSEYFDPLDGTPAGGKSFTWTAAVWLGWASPNAGGT